jgi:predicted permease
VLNDLRHSVRAFLQSPTIAIAGVCTLAIAIGASTAVFSVVDKILIRPLPMVAPDRLVAIWPRDRVNPATIGEISYATFRAWERDPPAGFDGLAAMGSVNWGLVLREGDPQTMPAAAVSASFFPLLGASALMGRTLLPADDRQGAGRVAVLAYGTWVRRFGSDPNILGRGLRFNRTAYTVVGVMPEGFDYPRGAELWVPVVPELLDASEQWKTDVLTSPGFGVLFVVGRLAPGVTVEAARGAVSARMAATPDAFRAGMEAALTPLDEHILGATRPALVALAACVALVLLIGCANVAVLLLVRASSRTHETATRLAMGASRWRIVRQCLCDALLLTTVGGVVGVVLAYWTVTGLVALAPSDVPRLDTVRVDARALLFTGAIGLATARAVGLGPGLQASRWNLVAVLGSGGARLAQSLRARRAFVVVQVGLALVLLVCAGLASRSFLNVLRIQLGFSPANVLTLDVTAVDMPAERHREFYTALLGRLRTLPGVLAAGAVYQRPLEHAGIGLDGTVLIEGQRTELEFKDWELNPTINHETVTPGFFEAIGTRVLRGRGFTDMDTERTPRVVVVSEGLARRLWPGRDALGQRIMPPGSLLADGRLVWSTVVGVVEDARYRGLADPRFDLFAPWLQNTDVRVKHVMVRTSGDPLALAGPIRVEIRRLEPAVIVENVRTMDRIVERATSPWRFSASTLALLSVVALALASRGLCATGSQTVIERTREIGVRVTVGALPRHIARLVLREGLSLTFVGIVIGLVAATAVGRALTGLLFGVSAIDPLTLVSTAALFLVVSVAATLLPAWRAARVDPVAALRR